MKQYKLVHGEYIEIGCWKMTEDRMGLDIDIEDAFPEEREEANWILNRLVEADAFPLPGDFLEYWQEQVNAYSGMLGSIQKTMR